jgi:hypothetical protein
LFDSLLSRFQILVVSLVPIGYVVSKDSHHESSYNRADARTVVCLAVLIVMVTLLRGEMSVEHPISRGFARVIPLGDGREVSLAEAEKSVSFDVLRPSTSLVSDSNIAKVWVRTAWSPEVWVQYGSGLVLTVQRPDFGGAAPEQLFQRQITEGIPGTIEQIGPVAAFVVPANDSDVGANLTMVVDGLEVTFVDSSRNFTTDQLADAAGSVVSSAQAT